jgi:hypothetical protein
VAGPCALFRINPRRSHRQIRLNSGSSYEPLFGYLLYRAAVMFRFSCLPSLLGFAGIVTALCCYARASHALPLETFAAPLSIRCEEGQRECGGILRVDGALGRHTGISILKGLAGEVYLKAGSPVGRLQIEGEDSPDVAITFSWDGDSNPDVLSGAGLNCFDVTQQGAYAFIISKVSVESACAKGVIAAQCPNFTIESRVYDSQDPTGQHFSASTIVRGQMKDADIAIPFSNFVRSGPRGKGNFLCAGAVTITLKFHGLEELEVHLGPMYTNGSEGVRLLPTPGVVPTVTSAPMTPTIVPSDQPTVQLSSVASVSPAASVPPLASAPPAASVPSAVPVVPKVPTKPARPSEVVYGSVVIGQ